MNCCDRNGHDCQQGRICPERFPTRRVHQPWDSEQVERPLEASDGAVLAVLFLGILFLFGVPLFIEVVLR